MYWVSTNNLSLGQTKTTNTFRYTCTVKPAHEVTSIKHSPVLKGHHFLIQSLTIPYELNLF